MIHLLKKVLQEEVKSLTSIRRYTIMFHDECFYIWQGLTLSLGGNVQQTRACCNTMNYLFSSYRHPRRGHNDIDPRHCASLLHAPNDPSLQPHLLRILYQPHRNARSAYEAHRRIRIQRRQPYHWRHYPQLLRRLLGLPSHRMAQQHTSD